MFLYWNNIILAKDHLRKGVFIWSLCEKRNAVHVKQNQKKRLEEVKKLRQEKNKTSLRRRRHSQDEESDKWWRDRVCKCCDLCQHLYECAACAYVRVWLCGVDRARSHAQFVCGLSDTYGEWGNGIPLHTGWWNCERKHWTEIINPPLSLSSSFSKNSPAP